MPRLVSPAAQVGRLAGAPMPGEAYWVCRVPAPIVGMAYPARVRWDELARLGVRDVVCLVDDAPAYDPAPLRLVATRLQDLYTRPDGPDDPQREADLVRGAAHEVARSVAGGRGVAVHCRGGRGRTGTVLGVALVELGLEADVVVGWLGRLHRARGRRGWPESPWQEEVVRAHGRAARTSEQRGPRDR